jgi:thiol-disulfide isomerase/thioredoxin
MRTVAIIATVVALIGISIPFTWDTHADTGGEPITAPFIEPVAAHASALELEAQADAAACMPNAKAATDFTLPALDGKKVSLSQFKGKVVLLNFWATWCGPCKAEIPGFVELQQQYKNDLVILGLSVDDPADKAKAFADQYKVNYPMVLGLGHDEIQDAYGPIYGIPASFLISRDGKVCKRHLGIAPKSQFEREIKALL